MKNKLEIFHRFGATLTQKGYEFLRKSFKIKTIEIPLNDLQNFISFNIPVIRIVPRDRKYFLTNWYTWLKLIENDWGQSKIYKKEKYDCDDFSYSFVGRMNEIYELNSVGIVWGDLFNKDTYEYIGSHLWNAMFIWDEELKLYFYEPMNDKWVLFEKGKDIIMGNSLYKPKSLRI